MHPAPSHKSLFHDVQDNREFNDNFINEYLVQMSIKNVIKTCQINQDLYLW